MSKDSKEEVLFKQARCEMISEKQFELYSNFYSHLEVLDIGIKEFSKYYIKKFERKMEPLPEFFDSTLLAELDKLQTRLSEEVSKFEQYLYDCNEEEEE